MCRTEGNIRRQQSGPGAKQNAFSRCHHQRDPGPEPREGLSSDPLQTSTSQAADTGKRHLGSLRLELRAPNRSHEPGASASVGEATLATNDLFGTLRFYWVNIQGTLNLDLWIHKA